MHREKKRDRKRTQKYKYKKLKEHIRSGINNISRTYFQRKNFLNWWNFIERQNLKFIIGKKFYKTFSAQA